MDGRRTVICRNCRKRLTESAKDSRLAKTLAPEELGKGRRAEAL